MQTLYMNVSMDVQGVNIVHGGSKTKLPSQSAIDPDAKRVRIHSDGQMKPLSRRKLKPWSSFFGTPFTVYPGITDE